MDDGAVTRSMGAVRRGGDDGGGAWAARRGGGAAAALSSSVEVGRGGAGAGLRIVAVTWNLAGKLPPASINSIVPGGGFDVYVVGTQECMVQCGTLKSFIKTSKAKWERRMQVLSPSFC